MKLTILGAVAAAVLATSGPALAGSKFGNAQQSWKQRKMLEEEWRRARAVGGYNDPVTAFGNIAAGRATEKDIRPGVNSIIDTPEIGTIRLKGRWN